MILQEKLSVTWKVHAVCAHLITFLERHQQGMASIAEQVGEAAHYDMVPVLQRHKVSEDHPEFGQRQVLLWLLADDWSIGPLLCRSPSP